MIGICLPWLGMSLEKYDKLRLSSAKTSPLASELTHTHINISTSDKDAVGMLGDGLAMSYSGH